MLKIFKNMKIGQKLIIGYIIVAIFAAIPGVIANSLMNTINTANDEAMTQYGFSQGDIGRAMYIIADYNKQVRDVISFNDTAAMKKALKKMEEDIEAYNGYVETVKLTLITESEIAQLDIIEAAFSAYITKAGEIVEMGNTIDTKIKHRAQSQAISELDPLYTDLNDAWQTLMDIKVADGSARGDEITAQTKMSQLMCLVLTVATLAFSIFSGIFVAKTVSKPIHSCVKRLEQLSNGDLSSPVETTGTKDETGILLNALEETTVSFKLIIDDLSSILDQLAKGDLTADTEKEVLYIGDYAPLLESLRKTVYSQNRALRTIYTSSDQVSLGSEQVSGGAQSLSEGTAAQASSVEILSEAIKSLMDDVERNAEDARAAGNLAVQTAEQMDMSNTQMTNMVAAMNDISDSSIKISQIMRTIEDIAFQTNILALNAAVEAARAGEAGKGFAVVADEVRNLAEKSAQASGNTAELIENSLKAVENGTKIASDTAKTLSLADESARRVAETIERISQASARQAEGLHKVTDGIENISGVIQTNSATAQESAAASEQLSGQAGMLKSLVEKFKLK